MKAYKPHTLPLESLDWPALVDLMGKANRYVARYDGLLQSVINPEVLLTPLRTKEAVLSSEIEGTQATLEEVMEFEAGQHISEGKKSDIYEIINYRVALSVGKEKMRERPLSLNMIRQLHQILMSGVRGDSRDPGEFRRIQNWIGSPGSAMEQARFVPPTVPDMKEALYNWESYIHFDDKDTLVQLAIIHAQFEIIHPFLDGNGRIGRILIPLFLYHKEVIQQPVFYMSDYLESNRQQYYDALKSITDSGNWTYWIRFFLEGIIKQAEKNVTQTRAIINLYEEVKIKLAQEIHSQFSIHCLDFIFTNPIFNSGKFYKETTVPKASAARLLKQMEETNIIDCLERGAGRRPSVYAFRSLINIVNR
jgi:Fic family protein